MRIHYPQRAVAFAAVTIAALASTGCGDDALGPEVPTMAVVAGTYNAGSTFGALTFTSSADGVITDLLAAGATLSLVLHVDGSVDGRLFVPGGAEDGVDMDEDMAGTWTLQGRTVRLQQNADTFVRDIAITFMDGTLTADQAFGDVRVRLILVQQ